jgi:dipeptidase D
MYSQLTETDARGIWTAFGEISEIPRCSKNEAAILAFLEKEGRALGLGIRRDAVGNLLITKPAQGIQGPTVVLQGHVDMVCEKNKGTEHDFRCDPINLQVTDGWVNAQGTTLGADNGIAVAMMLAVLRDNKLAHPPLECLFTIDEESALVGALELGTDLLTGKLLINLDSEDQGHFTIGCAGGVNVDATLPLTRKKAEGQTYSLAVRGYPGGHSGVEIDKGKGNAIKALGELLGHLAQQDPGLSLINLEGGDKHNAIPREAFATISSSLHKDQIQEIGEKRIADWKTRMGTEGRGIFIEMDNVENQSGAIQETLAILKLLADLPDGVAEYSQEVAGLVDTSNNLASVRTKFDSCQLLTSVRSSFVKKQGALVKTIEEKVAKVGGQTSTSDGYPPWPPSKENPLLNHCRKLYKEAYQEEPIVELIHAGLECGVIGAKYPGMQMISFGPDIRGAHTPEERLRVASAESVYDFLTKVLERGDQLPQ